MMQAIHNTHTWGTMQAIYNTHTWGIKPAIHNTHMADDEGKTQHTHKEHEAGKTHTHTGGKMEGIKESMKHRAEPTKLDITSYAVLG